MGSCLQESKLDFGDVTPIFFSKISDSAALILVLPILPEGIRSFPPPGPLLRRVKFPFPWRHVVCRTVGLAPEFHDLGAIAADIENSQQTTAAHAPVSFFYDELFFLLVDFG